MMKKFITLALIIGTTTFIQAQSNLVFNQVLNFNIGTGEPVTVPEGKVWKLESGISQGNVLISSINQEYGNNLDSSNMDAYSLQAYNMPMWLGQGTTLTLINGSFNFLSILEFNVVPISSSGGGGSVGGVSGGAGQYTSSNDYTVAESFTDIDGNEYGAVNIGGIIWSTSNLKVTKFSDGTPILQVASATEMQNTKNAAYYLNSGTGEVVYNWFAIVGDHDGNSNTPAKKLAPEGYRVTSVVDWKRLVDFYGGEDTAASYLVSKNWPYFPGLDKAGLNLMPGYMMNTSGSGIAYGWGTTSYRSRVSNWFGEFHTFNITTVDSDGTNGNFGYLINYNVATFTIGGTRETYTSALPVRVIKEY